MLTLTSFVWPLLGLITLLQTPAVANAPTPPDRGRDHFTNRSIQQLAVVQFRDGRALLRHGNERAVIRVGDQVGQGNWQVAAVTSKQVLLQQGERYAVLETQADGGGQPRMLTAAEVPPYLLQKPGTTPTKQKSETPRQN